MIEAIDDAQPLQRLDAGRQHAFAAGLVGRKVAALDDDDGQALLGSDNCDRQPGRPTAYDDQIPKLAGRRRRITDCCCASHSTSPLQQNQFAAEARPHRQQHTVITAARDV